MYWRSHPKIKQCAKAMWHGQVVAYPTESVWGLGCDPFNVHAVSQILALKKRPVEKGLILVAASIDQVEFLMEDLSVSQRRKLENSWPGPHTWLIPHNEKIPSCIYGQHSSVAVRVSNHPIVVALCEAFDGPIVSTSANPQGKTPAKNNYMARRYFGRSDILFAPGNVGKQAKPSTIQDLNTGELVRS